MPLNILIIRLLIESSGELLRVHRIDKSTRIDLPDLFGDRLDLIPSHNGVEHIAFMLFVASDPFKKRGIMVCIFPDLFVDLIRFGGDDEQRLLLVTLVQGMQDLCGSKLEYDGIQRLIPTEQIPSDQKNNTVTCENVIPCLNAVLFREKDGDKIRAAAGGACIQAEGDGTGVQDTAEYTDEQRIVCHLESRQYIRKNTRQNDHQTGIPGKFFPDMFKTDEDRNGI